MFNKNLKYYRLKKNMSKKELASLIGATYYDSQVLNIIQKFCRAHMDN